MTREHTDNHSPPEIELHIDELVLHDLPLVRGQGTEVMNSLQAELKRLITNGGLAQAVHSSPALLSARPIRITEASIPAQLGQQIAQAIYGSLDPAPSLSGQVPANRGAF